MSLLEILKKFKLKNINHITNNDLPVWSVHIFINNNKVNIASRNKFTRIPKEVDTIIIEDILNYITNYQWLPDNIQTIYFVTDIKQSILKTIPDHVMNCRFNFEFQHIEELTDPKLYTNRNISIYEANKTALMSKRFITYLKNQGLKIKKVNKQKIYFYSFVEDLVNTHNVYNLILSLIK